jgi:hypothetical protein
MVEQAADGHSGTVKYSATLHQGLCQFLWEFLMGQLAQSREAFPKRGRTKIQ